MDDFLRRLDDGEDIGELISEAQADKRVFEAQRRLEATISEYGDVMTGQDGEEAVDRAARDLIDARDDKLRRTDPESYNERKQMGLL